ncbi:MAG TPA: TetR/AcrR family transcriptional regulator [Solirubrobacteraceae bacterium]|jgi:AcrR family transcriptional regulator|nr:TetR/AcrR family transcriptional regulator [Solirubrobacteraceae bacterium]
MRSGEQAATAEHLTRRLPAPERRALIEQAAARLFARDGYAATTVEQIVAAAGVSKPILYRHFESKRELYRSLLERRRDELAAAPIERLLQADGSLQARLAAMLDTWFEHVEQHPDSSRLLFEDITDDVELRSLQQELRGRQRAADVALMREFGPPLPEHELEPLGEIIRSSLTGLALWRLDRPDVPRATVVGAMTRMIGGMLA